MSPDYLKEQTSERFSGYWNAVGRARRHVQRDIDGNSELKHTKQSLVSTVNSDDSISQLTGLHDTIVTSFIR